MEEEKARSLTWIGEPVTIRMGNQDHDIEHHYEKFELDGITYALGMFVALSGGGSGDAGVKCANQKRRPHKTVVAGMFRFDFDFVFGLFYFRFGLFSLCFVFVLCCVVLCCVCFMI